MQNMYPLCASIISFVRWPLNFQILIEQSSPALKKKKIDSLNITLIVSVCPMNDLIHLPFYQLKNFISN